MKPWIFSFMTIAAICTAARAKDFVEQSTDMRRQTKAEQRAAAAEGSLVSPADVGDVDSFGRNVHFLGVAFTGFIQLQRDCSTPSFSGPDDRCFVPNPPSTLTVLEIRDVGRMRLPAKASNSLLCHSITSQPLWHFTNTTADAGNAQFRYLVFVTIENEVLNDPNLIDPTTGQPFGGALEQGFSMITDSQTLHPGDQATRRNISTRSCQGGLISKAGLIDSFGLTPAQADEFFKKPMTIRLHMLLLTQFVDLSTVLYGLRLYGD
jgi:hypothetical protein